MEAKQIISKISKIKELAYSHIEEELSSRGYEGLLPSHGNILFFLCKRGEPVAITEIVENVDKAKSTLTSNLRTLEKLGYIKKTKNPEDSRSTLISLTDKGINFMPVFKKISIKVVKDFYGDMEEKEIQELLISLSKIENNLKLVVS